MRTRSDEIVESCCDIGYVAFLFVVTWGAGLIVGLGNFFFFGGNGAQGRQFLVLTGSVLVAACVVCLLCLAIASGQAKAMARFRKEEAYLREAGALQEP